MNDIRLIRYCKKCTIPETRPHTKIDTDGICSACKYFEYRDKIDWSSRKVELEKIFDKYRNDDYYDCLVPSSGGKDSTYQVLKVLEFGMKPLVVTITTDWLTDLGRKNIENLKNIGVDYIEYSLNPKIRRRLNKFTLETIGDITWSEEVGIFCSVARIACKMNIPLIIWGENPQNENGGPENNSDFFEDIIQRVDHKWFEEFAVPGSLRSSDILNAWEDDTIKPVDLMPYTYPDKKEIDSKNLIGIFLGHYIPWDGHKNAEIAIENGFSTYNNWVEGNIVNYENLDNYLMRIHDYFKFLKYGYDRVSDWSSLAIRRGRMSRKEGIQLTRDYGGKYPNKYLGKNLNEILDYINLTEENFKTICERFTNKKIFKKNSDGTLMYDNHGNLIKNNHDNV
jgi:N-acetyl sugar amidotransferase